MILALANRGRTLNVDAEEFIWIWSYAVEVINEDLLLDTECSWWSREV